MIEINDIFELAFRFVTETNENIFLTGKAGTGKTTFLKYLKENCSKNIIVAAPTGVAAINAGGVTLHSLFQLPFHPFIPTAQNKDEMLQRLRFTTRRLQLLRKMDMLVIDEISMVRCDTMDAIDTILRYSRRKYDLPFGGVQVLFIGDLYQLPPVATHQDWIILQEYYNSEFFFDSQVIRDEMPVMIELKKIFRQREDTFIRILNNVRNNQMDSNDFDELHQRYQPGFTPAHREKYITLTTHNSQADRINNLELQKLGRDKFVYKAEITDDFPESMYPAEKSLELKAGAQVMFLKNDIEKRYFNGKIGIVKTLDNEEITVDCDGHHITVEPEKWENIRYTLNRSDGKLEQEVLGTFVQFPLRLAWAITIHKSQGLTFEKVMIDAGSAFSSGQVYVALSRCTSLEGIVLLSRIPSSAIQCNDSVVRSHQSMSPKGSLAERFKGARQVYTQQLFDEIFSFSEIHKNLDFLESKIQEHYEKLNKESLPWISALKNEFATLQAIGLKFIDHLNSYMLKEPVVERNRELQKRITDAANHFSPKFISLKDTVLHHPLETEYRETGRDIDEYLNQVLLLLVYQIYLLEYCKQPFSVTEFLKHKVKYALPRLSTSSYGSKRKQGIPDVTNKELFETLKRWRDVTCQDNNLPIYMVANQASLKEITTFLPSTKKDLMKIKGFGKAKAEKYGDDILDIVKDYCEKNNLESGMAPVTSVRKEEEKPRTGKEKTQTVTFRMYKAGKSIEEIAGERNMVMSTIEGHLATCIADGLIDINEFVPLKNQELIRSAATTLGWENYKALKNQLPENISYGQIRMTRASIRKNDVE